MVAPPSSRTKGYDPTSTSASVAHPQGTTSTTTVTHETSGGQTVVDYRGPSGGYVDTNTGKVITPYTGTNQAAYYSGAYIPKTPSTTSIPGVTNTTTSIPGVTNTFTPSIIQFKTDTSGFQGGGTTAADISKQINISKQMLAYSQDKEFLAKSTPTLNTPYIAETGTGKILSYYTTGEPRYESKDYTYYDPTKLPTKEGVYQREATTEEIASYRKQKSETPGILKVNAPEMFMGSTALGSLVSPLSSYQQRALTAMETKRQELIQESYQSGVIRGTALQTEGAIIGLAEGAVAHPVITGATVGAIALAPYVLPSVAIAAVDVGFGGWMAKNVIQQIPKITNVREIGSLLPEASLAVLGLSSLRGLKGTPKIPTENIPSSIIKPKQIPFESRLPKDIFVKDITKDIRGDKTFKELYPQKIDFKISKTKVEQLAKQESKARGIDYNKLSSVDKNFIEGQIEARIRNLQPTIPTATQLALKKYTTIPKAETKPIITFDLPTQKFVQGQLEAKMRVKTQPDLEPFWTDIGGGVKVRTQDITKLKEQAKQKTIQEQQLKEYKMKYQAELSLPKQPESFIDIGGGVKIRQQDVIKLKEQQVAAKKQAEQLLTIKSEQQPSLFLPKARQEALKVYTTKTPKPVEWIDMGGYKVKYNKEQLRQEAYLKKKSEEYARTNRPYEFIPKARQQALQLLEPPKVIPKEKVITITSKDISPISKLQKKALENKNLFTKQTKELIKKQETKQIQLLEKQRTQRVVTRKTLEVKPISTIQEEVSLAPMSRSEEEQLIPLLLQGTKKDEGYLQIRPVISDVGLLNSKATAIAEAQAFGEVYDYAQPQAYEYAQPQEQIFKQPQEQKMKEISILKGKTITTNIFKIPEDIIIKKKKSVGILKSALKKLKKSRAFEVLIKKKGKFVKVNQPLDLTKGEAIRFGERITRSSLAATFKVAPTKRETYKLEEAYTPNPLIFRAYQIKAGRKIATPDTYIQRARKLTAGGSRLGSRQEIFAIQQARRAFRL